MVQLSHSYLTTGKTVALTRQTFVGKVMSLLFNMLFRLVITFLARNKHLLISWLQSSSAVILEPRKIMSATLSPFIFHLFSIRSDGTACHDLSFLNVEHCLFLDLEWKLTFYSPVGTAEFSKFAHILCAAFSQHLLGFKVAQMEFHNLL